MFVNETTRLPDDEFIDSPGAYHFNHPSRLLFLWSRLFQRIVSLAGTHDLTHTFHTSDCGIHMSEGGCNIVGIGELVLLSRSCMFETFGAGNAAKADRILATNRMRDLIDVLVLNWDPMKPGESLTELAAAHIGVDHKDLAIAVVNAMGGGPFGGNALDTFFDRTFSGWEARRIDRPYQRYCLIEIEGRSEAHVDQLWADQDLAKELKELLRERLQGSRYNVFACSPERSPEEGLRFWVNTGSATQIDGFQTEATIRAFLASSENLVVENKKRRRS